MKICFMLSAITLAILTASPLGAMKRKAEDGQTALHYAAGEGKIETLRLIIRSAGENAFSLACHGNEFGETPLYLAAFHGSKKVVIELLYTAPNSDAVRELINKPRKKENKTSLDCAKPQIKLILAAFLDGNIFDKIKPLMQAYLRDVIKDNVLEVFFQKYSEGNIDLGKLEDFFAACQRDEPYINEIINYFLSIYLRGLDIDTLNEWLAHANHNGPDGFFLLACILEEMSLPRERWNFKSIDRNLSELGVDIGSADLGSSDDD